MGLFDYVSCQYPTGIDGTETMQFQTKSFDPPRMDRYEIRHDGTLWREVYDIEDRSDPNATGFLSLNGCMTPINIRWEPFADFIGSIYFYHDDLEFIALIRNGLLISLDRCGDHGAEPT